MAETDLDWNELSRAYARLLEERGPGWRGTPYEGATHRSKDPGNERYAEGEASRDVGLFDPVDALADILSFKGTSLMRGVGRALTEPGPSLRGVLRSQRGSTGGSAFPWKLTRSEADLEALAQRIRAAMAKDTTGAPGFKSASRLPGEDLLTWERRLREYEKHYGLDDFYTRKPTGSEDVWGDPGLEGDVAPAQDISWSAPFDSAARREKFGHLLIDKAMEGEVPRRTVELGTRRTAPLPDDQPSRANEYADIIRKLFEQGGR